MTVIRSFATSATSYPTTRRIIPAYVNVSITAVRISNLAPHLLVSIAKCYPDAHSHSHNTNNMKEQTVLIN
jgi:hypothetical protein